MVGWLIGWLGGWLVGGLVGWLVDWLVSWLKRMTYTNLCLSLRSLALGIIRKGQGLVSLLIDWLVVSLRYVGIIGHLHSENCLKENSASTFHEI